MHTPPTRPHLLCCWPTTRLPSEFSCGHFPRGPWAHLDLQKHLAGLCPHEGSSSCSDSCLCVTGPLGQCQGSFEQPLPDADHSLEPQALARSCSQQENVTCETWA